MERKFKDAFNNPDATAAFTPQPQWDDPTFAECSIYFDRCIKAFGLRIYNSTYIFNYGAGLYSFFENYDVTCALSTHNCQDLMVSIEQSEGIYLYALNTIGTVNMVEVDQIPVVPSVANPSFSFVNTLALFEYP